MDPLTRAVRLLGQLAPQQLEELRQRIVALQQFGSATLSDGPPQADELFVLNAIADTLRTQGYDYTAVGVMARDAAAKLADGHSFRDKVPGLMQFLANTHPNTVGRQALLLLGLQFLVLELRKRGTLVTYKTLMAQIHRVGPALDAHFPGYASAGLLRWVVGRPIIHSV
jgi:hypothetical protein